MGIAGDVIAAMVFVVIMMISMIIYCLNSHKRWAVGALATSGLFIGLAFGRLMDVLSFVQNLPC